MRHISRHRLRCRARVLLIGGGLLLPAAPASGEEVAPLPLSAFNVEWEARRLPQAWTASGAQPVVVGVRNASTSAWPNIAQAGGPLRAVRLSYCWRQPQGAPWDCLANRVELPTAVAPGQKLELSFSVTAPPEPGPYRLEFDLVQERVTWFSFAGAQTLSVPVAVMAGAATPSRRRAGLLVAGALFMLLAVLFHCGWGLSWLLWPRPPRPGLMLFVPAVGLAALSAVGHGIAYLQRGTDWFVLPVLAGFGLINLYAWGRGARPRFSRSDRGAWALATLTLLLAVAPIVQTGRLATFAGEIDAVLYVARAEWLQEHGLMVLAENAAEDPIRTATADAIRNGLRQGDQYFLAVSSSLTGLRPHQLFSLVNAIFAMLVPLGLYSLAVHAMALPRASGLLAAGLLSISPLLSFVVLNGFLSQAGGIGMFCFALHACLLAVRKGGRASLLAGVLLAGLAALYPAYLVYLLPTALAATGLRIAILQWRRRRQRSSAFALAPWLRFARRWAATALCAWISAPVAWMLAYKQLRGIAGLASGGGLGAQGSEPGMPLPGEIFGLISHAHHALLLAQPLTPRWAEVVLAIPVFTLAGSALLLFRRRALIVAGPLLLVLGAGALQQRFLLDGGRGFAYGYFKVVSLLMVPAVLALAHGFGAGRRWVRGLAPSPARTAVHVGLWAVLAVVAVLSAGNFLGTAVVMFRHRVAVDAAAQEIESIRPLIASDEPLLLADRTWPGRAWTMYLLKHPRIHDRSTVPQYGAAAEARSPRLIRLALFERSASPPVARPAEPWLDPARSEVIWQNSRFDLRARREPVLAEIVLLDAAYRTTLDQGLSVGASQRVLVVEGPTLLGGRLVQHLDWCPNSLEVWLEASEPITLTESVAGAHSRTRTLPAGVQAIRLDGGPPIRLQARPTARVLAVRALGEPSRP